MKSSLKKLIALVGMTVLAVSSLHAQDSGALVEALVKKGVLTDQEGEEIRADLTKEYATTSAGKLNVSSHITQLKLYGDGRLRYEYVGQEGQNNGQNNSHNWRARYRIRVGADYVFTDNFKAGFELESSTDNDSANQSFGNGFGKSSINVGLIYLQYKPWDFVTLTGGKMKNPLYTTDLVWDADINPEGAAEVFSWDINDQFTIGVTAAQFNYTENSDSAGLTGSSSSKMLDSWIYAGQLPMTYKFSKDIKATFAPGFMTTTGNNGSTIVTGSPSITNTVSATNLNVITAPGDVQFKLFNQKTKFYWDLAYNMSGESRVHQTYGIVNQNNSLEDSVAWLVGLQVGDNKKKGDWLVGVDFRQTGLGAVDPNLADSDFGNGNLNQQGVKIRTGYNFTDFLQGNITYFNTWNYKENIATTGQTPNNVSGLNGVNATSRLQLDVVWKF
ncbi:MAG: hypothetical protein B9S32_17000 [Verrucomicrobia bacterium Tous-C9LFEB]|nr:MAG: hypothetical protein B9S32_17000 [Verrucomicrobia bacterium Tous-C9LFEB]